MENYKWARVMLDAETLQTAIVKKEFDRAKLLVKEISKRSHGI